MNAEQIQKSAKALKLAHLSEHDFAVFGMNELAYIKPTDGPGFMIHAADGTPLGQADSHELALFAVRHHGLEPLSIH
jgi:hypothetical protein